MYSVFRYSVIPAISKVTLIALLACATLTQAFSPVIAQNQGVDDSSQPRVGDDNPKGDDDNQPRVGDDNPKGDDDNCLTDDCDRQNRSDFNDDSKSDILWRKDDGTLSVWFMNGTNLSSSSYLNPQKVDPKWQVVATGDFNSDGKSDILWQHQDGDLITWLMNGTTLTRSISLSPKVSDKKWQVVGTGDFNNDRQTDILWQHKDGYLSVWLMNGTTLTRSTLLSPKLDDKKWQVVGVADFNSDRQTDILLQHQDGYLSVWLMNGTNLVSSSSLNPKQVEDKKWQVVGTGDFNSDRQTDILWRNDDGYLTIWLMNGTNLVRSQYHSINRVSDTTWKVVSSR